MNKPHKHAELIKAWADGAEIQRRFFDEWRDVTDNPCWFTDQDYRITPEPSDLEKYGIEVGDIWKDGNNGNVYVLAEVFIENNKAKAYTLYNPKVKATITEVDTLIFRRGVVNKL
jgi:hypothetical protein